MIKNSIFTADSNWYCYSFWISFTKSINLLMLWNYINCIAKFLSTINQKDWLIGIFLNQTPQGILTLKSIFYARSYNFYYSGNFYSKQHKIKPMTLQEKFYLQIFSKYAFDRSSNITNLEFLLDLIFFRRRLWLSCQFLQASDLVGGSHLKTISPTSLWLFIQCHFFRRFLLSDTL